MKHRSSFCWAGELQFLLVVLVGEHVHSQDEPKLKRVPLGSLRVGLVRGVEGTSALGGPVCDGNLSVPPLLEPQKTGKDDSKHKSHVGPSGLSLSTVLGRHANPAYYLALYNHHSLQCFIQSQLHSFILSSELLGFILSSALLGFIQSLQRYSRHCVVIIVNNIVSRRPVLLEHLRHKVQVVLV